MFTLDEISLFCQKNGIKFRQYVAQYEESDRIRLYFMVTLKKGGKEFKMMKKTNYMCNIKNELKGYITKEHKARWLSEKEGFYNQLITFSLIE